MNTPERLIVKNTSSEAAPAYGLAEISGGSALARGAGQGEPVVEIRKPTGTGQLVAIGPVGIPTGGHGEGLRGTVYVRHSESSDVTDGELAATAGSWDASVAGGGTKVSVIGDPRDLGPTGSEFKVSRVLIGSGGGNGSASDTAWLLGDLAGYGFDTRLGATIGAAKVLRRTFADGVVTTDLLGPLEDAYPVEGIRLTLSSTGTCCASDAVNDRIRFDGGIGAEGENRAYDGDAASGAIAPTGRGAAKDATLTLTITDGSATITKSTDAAQDDTSGATLTNHGDGTWESDSQSLTTLARGWVRLTVSDGAVSESIAIYYAKGDSTSEWDAAPPQPVAPRMDPDSDTGVSNVDGVTSTDPPGFLVTSPIGSDPTGPAPTQLIDGVPVGTIEATGVTFFDPPAGQVDRLLTPDAAVGEHYHTAQLGLATINSSGPHRVSVSPVTRFEIDPDADADVTPQTFIRTVEVDQRSDGLWITDPGRCPVEAPPVIASRIAGRPVARGTADAAFTTSTTSVAVSDVTVVSDVTDPAPATPTAMLQPVEVDDRVEGATGATVYAEHDGSDWVIVQVEIPAPAT